MKKTGIFRDELPGEKKTIINLLMTGYIVTISCLGYMAFYIFIQMGQLERIVNAINVENQTAEQVAVLKSRMARSTGQLKNEMIGLAIFGSVISIIGGIYTFNLFVRPLRKLVEYAETRGKTVLPEFKSNHEIKQLATALTDLTSQSSGPSSKESSESRHQNN